MNIRIGHGAACYGAHGLLYRSVAGPRPKARRRSAKPLCERCEQIELCYRECRLRVGLTQASPFREAWCCFKEDFLEYEISSSFTFYRGSTFTGRQPSFSNFTDLLILYTAVVSVGTFPDPVHVQYLASGDVNGDGNTDLLTNIGFNPRLLFGDGKGGFSLQPVSNVLPPLGVSDLLLDVNGDGFADYINISGGGFDDKGGWAHLASPVHSQELLRSWRR